MITILFGWFAYYCIKTGMATGSDSTLFIGCFIMAIITDALFIQSFTSKPSKPPQ